MSTQYGSVRRTFTARNYYTGTITPPNDFVLGSSNKFFPAISIAGLLNKNSNIIIKGIGIFSNFADGLVFKNPGDVMPVHIYVQGKKLSNQLTGTFSVDTSNTSLVGVGTLMDTELNAGDGTILLNPPNSALPQQIVKIAVSTVNPLLGTLLTPPLLSYSNVRAWTMTQATYVSVVEYVKILNMMQPCEVFLSPIQYSNNATDLITIDVVSLIDPSCTFMTKSVNTSFAGSAINFDVVLDIETTP